MIFFRNAHIGLRLGLAFGAIVAMIIGLVGVSWTMLHHTRSAVEQVVDDRYPKADAAREIYDGVNTQARFLRNAVIGATLRDAKEVSESLAKVEAAVAANTQVMDRLKSKINTPKGEALFKAMLTARGDYATARNRAVRLLTEGQIEESARLVLGDVRTQQNRFLETVQAMGDFQRGLMRESSEAAKRQIDRVIQVVLGVSLVVVLLAVLAAWAITRSITTPIDQAVRVARAVAAGDLSVRVQATSNDQAGQLLAALAEMTENLSSIVTTVRTGSDSVATASTQIAQGNQDLSHRTEKQAAALEQTAATMEELSSTVRTNADSARQANQLAQDAAHVAVRGGDVVSQVVGTMQGISESSRRIGDIIGVIDGIAFQTNILALNAAVEAARAGEQGRGFAVVASEVRSLAGRSAEAAKEIKSLIERNVQQVEQGTSQVDQAGRTMAEIVASIQQVSTIVAEITAATSEQSNGIYQVGVAVSEMDQTTQQNAALVEQSAAAAESLKTQAEQLVEAVAFFKAGAAAGGGGAFAASAYARTHRLLPA